jgi:acid phosphatase
MKYRPLIVGFVLSAVAFSAFGEPQNLVTAKKNIEHYVSSGQYNDDIAHQYTKAHAYLAKRIKENKAHGNNKKLAVVFDVDETTLSNYPYMLKKHFCASAKQFDRVANEGHEKAIPAALKFYRYLQKNKITPFFITGRLKYMKSATAHNLNKVGYTHYRALSLRSKNDRRKSVTPFKVTQRKKIEAQGYDIVLTIGDQYSDLNGGYADKRIKLPDPFYYIP